MLDQTTHVVESMESVILAVILGIGEKRVTIHATTTVVAERKPVIVVLEPVIAVTLGITEPTVQIFVAQAAVGQTTPVTLTLEIAIVVTQDTQGQHVATVSVCQTKRVMRGLDYSVCNEMSKTLSY